MKKMFVRQGTAYIPTNDEQLQTSPTLPVGTYLVKFHPEKGMYFEKTDDLPLPSRMYGDEHQSRTNRLVNTYNERTVNTSVMAMGEKGSGKTLLAKKVSEMMRMNGYPTILVNGPPADYGLFGKLIGELNTPSMIFFDEFEKMFDEKKEQIHLLSLLDGTSSHKHLFFFTSNTNAVSEYMINRPGRIYYKYEYESLPMDIVKEYVQQNLKTKHLEKDVLEVCESFVQMNFDIMQTIVEETDRYQESPQKFMRFLNASPLAERNVTYNAKISVNGKHVIDAYAHSSPIVSNQGYAEINLYQLPEEWKEIFDNTSTGNISSGEVSIYKDNFVEFIEGKHVYEIIFNSTPPDDEDEDQEDETTSNGMPSTGVIKQFLSKKAKRKIYTTPDGHYKMKIVLTPAIRKTHRMYD